MAFWKRKKEEPGETVESSQEREPLPEPQTEDAEGETTPKKGLFARFRNKLQATHRSIVGVLTGKGRIDDELLDELEEALIIGDVGVEASLDLIEELRERVREEGKKGSSEIEWVKETLKDLVLKKLVEDKREMIHASEGPTIYLVVGVNGVGKTTAIGKLAHRFVQEGKKVVLGAADTFRAAAIDQLRVWAERAGADIIASQEGVDPAAVVFDTLSAARSREADYVIIDTAGRLHTKKNLMQELGKIGRVIKRDFPEAPHETLLVLDASTGQNGLTQAKVFLEAVPVTGVILTKLDGTAKGGVTISVYRDLKIPVKLVGLGEGIGDLEDFSPEAFVEAIFE